MPNLITVNHLQKYYGERHVLEDITFSVQAGEKLAVIGPSGCGKSTILRIISGLTDLTAGEMNIGSDRIGMAFQYSALLNSYTVAENVLLALYHSSLSLSEKDRIVREKLDLLGLLDFYDSMPNDLSGGQQKRVAFARAIVNEPKILLFDEPTAGLDPISSTIVENCINELTVKYNSATIVVTHQHSTIERSSDQIICLFDGRIVWSGHNAELHTSDNPYIRQFIDGTMVGPFTAL